MVLRHASTQKSHRVVFYGYPVFMPGPTGFMCRNQACRLRALSCCIGGTGMAVEKPLASYDVIVGERVSGGLPEWSPRTEGASESLWREGDILGLPMASG